MLKSVTAEKFLPIGIVSFLAVLSLLSIWKIPQWQVQPIQQQINTLKTSKKAVDPKEIVALEKSKLDAENVARTVLVQGAGGLFAATAAYIAWRNLKATQEKQVAERFSKAVEQLGSENIHVCLGGIYELEQISKDAEEKYYWRVIETLAAYIRIKSPCIDENKPIEAHIQEAMRVLARRRYNYGHPLEPDRLNLCKVNLHSLQLPSKSKLQGMDLTESNLQKAKLLEVQLQEAKLNDANLRGAYLLDADLSGVELNGADLQESKLFKARLQEAKLAGAEFIGATLINANLRKAVCIRANFAYADLRLIDLQGAVLWEANFLNTDLREADLHQAKFNDNGKSVRLGKDAVNLTWEQIDKVNSYTMELLPNKLLKQRVALAKTLYLWLLKDKQPSIMISFAVVLNLTFPKY